MSQRGSFVTEYIYCDKCANAVEAVLTTNRHKYLCAQRLRSYEGDDMLPIIAGKVGGLYNGEEEHVFEFELVPEIEAAICHPVGIAVMAEDCEPRVKLFIAKPKMESAEV